MSREDDMEQKIIDVYYENKHKSDEYNSSSSSDFEEKLKLSLSKMDAANNVSFDLDVNILGLISEGEKIKEKKQRKEFLLFISLAVFILSAIIFATLAINEKIFIYYQIAVFLFMPVSLIPLAKAASNREA